MAVIEVGREAPGQQPRLKPADEAIDAVNGQARGGADIGRTALPMFMLMVGILVAFPELATYLTKNMPTRPSG